MTNDNRYGNIFIGKFNISLFREIIFVCTV